jgi:cyanate permease
VIGLLRDASGSYALPFYTCIGLELIAAALILVRGRAAIADQESRPHP